MTSREYTILIVDDSIEDRATYCRYLSSKLMVSYQIIETESGESGLEQTSSIQPDLILLDYLLPDCNGLEFIQKLKQIAKLPPIIMLTEEGNVGIAVKAMKNGVEDYLIKGQLTPEILAASVRNVLQQNDLQDLSTKSFQQQQLIAETALRIRKSLDLSEIRVQILEASEDYIVLTDTKGQVIWHNPQMKEVVSIAKTADLTQLSIAQYHPPWALNIIQEQGIPTAISKGTWLGETALLTYDDQEIPVSQLIIVHKSFNGKVEFISTVMRDLSLQKKTEKSLEEKALELKWLNQELLKITSLLKKRNQELDRFAYVTSHDLKAPLRAIANLATWLSEDLTGQIPDENQQQLQLMQSRVKRMDGLIQGLLTYSRVGRAKTTVRDVEVRDIVRSAIDSVNPPPEFEIIVALDLPKLRTEAVLLEQVFSNLISNAVKYHDQLNGKITVSVTEQAKFYEFAVADNGIGIEPQYQDRIFTIFQTLQARDTIESTGIGLSIVKKIVEGQGGEVRVESELGKGSTFYFTWHK
jgi:signal transduction histidine kinase